MNANKTAVGGTAAASKRLAAHLHYKKIAIFVPFIYQIDYLAVFIDFEMTIQALLCMQ